MSKFLTLLALFLFLNSFAHAADKKWQQRGLASWFGKENPRMASGERYDPNGLTAAHRTLPFGTHVKVTNLKSGKSAVVCINDRGPFIRSRIIDVSKAAAVQLNMIASGTATVLIELTPKPPAPAKKLAAN